MTNTEFDKNGEEIVDMDQQQEPIVQDVADTVPEAVTDTTDSEPVIEEVEDDDDDDDDIDDDDDDEDEDEDDSDMSDDDVPVRKEEDNPTEPIDLK